MYNEHYQYCLHAVSRRVRATKEERSTLHDHEGASENTSAAGVGGTVCIAVHIIIEWKLYDDMRRV